MNFWDVCSNRSDSKAPFTFASRQLTGGAGSKSQVQHVSRLDILVSRWCDLRVEMRVSPKPPIYKTLRKYMV
jgi:hypothetical protein